VADATVATASVLLDSTVPDGGGADGVDDLVGQLAVAGIEVYADPASPPLVPVTEPRSPMRLLLAQVSAMELEVRAGAGIPVEELDGAVGGAVVEDDGVDAAGIAAPPSAVIAAWIDVGGTAAFGTCRPAAPRWRRVE
jgi:hypothetical protein